MSRCHAARVAIATLASLLCLALAGCASTARETTATHESDPFESTNRVMFQLNEKLDEYLLGPVSRAYGTHVPQLLRDRVGRFFSNLGEPKIILNDFLQGKADQGLSDTARFVFNSTIGIGGLFDIASPIGLPAHQEDLGQTLAVWGVPQGPYLFLPLLGPNTLRNLPDIPLSIYADPLHYTNLSTAARLSLGGTEAVDLRYNLEDEIRAVKELAVDRYAFTRSAYLQRRRAQIFDGQPPLDDELELLFEEEEELEEDGYLRIE